MYYILGAGEFLGRFLRSQNEVVLTDCQFTRRFGSYTMALSFVSFSNFKSYSHIVKPNLRGKEKLSHYY